MRAPYHGGSRKFEARAGDRGAGVMVRAAKLAKSRAARDLLHAGA